MKKKVKIIRNILSILLSAALVFGEMSMPVYAAPDDEPGDLLVYDDSVDGLLLEEVNDDADIVYEGEDDLLSVGHIDDFLQEDELIPDGVAAPESDKDGGLSPKLSEAQQNTAISLEKELEQLDGLEAGADYIDNEAIFLADSKAEALRVASLYGAQLKYFADGVATLEFEDKNTEEVFADKVSDVEVVNEAAAIEKSLTDDDFSNDRSSEEDMAIIEEAGDVDISALPDVPVYANYIYHVSVNPNDDPLFKNSDMAPKGQWFHESINSQGAWDKGADGTGVTVAVIDTGIDSSNNDIDSSQTLWAASFTNGEDENGHGTHCIGIVAARDNSIGGLGVAPNATIISVRAGDRKGALTNADIAQSINMAVNAGADILSMSFGGTQYNEAVNSAIQNALGKGVVCIAAAGNEATSTKTYPACYNGVIAVGAYDADNQLAWYSNYGSWVTLAAPGSDILATMVDDPGAEQRKYGSFWDEQTAGCSYGKISGTSMATPVVAGVAALILSKNPSYTVEQVKDALINSAPDKVYKGKGTVKRGIDALKAVDTEGETDQPPVDTDKKTGHYLYAAVGPSIMVKQGKSSDLKVHTSFDTKVNPISYASTSPMVTVSKKGVVKVDKKAEPGETATITISCRNLVDTVTVTVIAGNTPSTKLNLLLSPSTPLSTDSESPDNTGYITMQGGDLDRPYYFEIQKNNIINFNNNLTFGYTSASGVMVPIKAIGPGTATVTAYATDGSGLKASVKVTVISPIKSVDITYMDVPLNTDTYSIKMALGASLPLKAVAKGPNGNKSTGKIKYTWSGPHVDKGGKVTAPKTPEEFTVSVTAESNGLIATKSVRIRAEMPYKLKYLGYYAKVADNNYMYFQNINSGGDADGDPYAVGSVYGYADSRMPDFSGWEFEVKKGIYRPLKGPFGFVSETSAKKLAYYGDDSAKEAYKNNYGIYVLNVKGPGVTNVTYNDFGVRSFVPSKKGNYKFIFTALDGSGKSFTVNFKVTQDNITKSVEPGEIKQPAITL